MSATAPKPAPGPRWRCSTCGSTKVRVLYTLMRWYHENTDGELTEVDFHDDGGAEDWYCEQCNECCDADEIDEMGNPV